MSEPTREERPTPEQRRVDLVASLNEAGAFLMRVQAELHESRERATAAEAERDKYLGALGSANESARRRGMERDQLRAELERERGVLAKYRELYNPFVCHHCDRFFEEEGELYRHVREMHKDAAMGVAEPTGGKAELK